MMTEKTIANKKEFHFYGEWVEFRDENEKEEAKTYLNLWKKFFVRKLPSTVTLVEEQWIQKPAIAYGAFGYPSLGMKIKTEGYIPRDLDEQVL